MSKLNKFILAGLLAASASASHAAAIVFTVNPMSNGLSTSSTPVDPFNADGLVGASSARIRQTSVDSTGAYHYSGQGYILYSSFTLNNGSSNVDPIDSFLNYDTKGTDEGYNLFVRFNQTFTCSQQLRPGVTDCSVDTIDLSLLASHRPSPKAPNGGITTVAATPGSDATIVSATPEIVLATGNVVLNVGAPSVAGINEGLGSTENVNTNLVLTAAGQAFFTSRPMISVSFNAFTNSAGGATYDAALQNFAINDESGKTTFGNAAEVPEPGSLALMGLALAGVASFRRRKV